MQSTIEKYVNSREKKVKQCRVNITTSLTQENQLFLLQSVNGSVFPKVKTFDAFPKVDPQHQVRSQRGGLSTLLTYFCGLLILWIELVGILGYVDRQFTVDDQIRSALTINVDMIVAMPASLFIPMLKISLTTRIWQERH